MTLLWTWKLNGDNNTDIPLPGNISSFAYLHLTQGATTIIPRQVRRLHGHRTTTNHFLTTMSANPPLHIAWHSVPFTLVECQLACALSIYIRFEDGTPLDDTTIGEIIGASSGLQNVNCAGLVNHLKLTNNVYPEVLAGGPAVAKWARFVLLWPTTPLFLRIGSSKTMSRDSRAPP